MSDNEVAAARVLAVLLADGWHRLVRGSFRVGPLSFGAEAGPGTPGFRFEEANAGRPYQPTVLVDPLDSIIAVRQVTRPRGASATQPGQRPAGGSVRTGASSCGPLGSGGIEASAMSTSTAAAGPTRDSRADWRDEAACRDRPGAVLPRWRHQVCPGPGQDGQADLPRLPGQRHLPELGAGQRPAGHLGRHDRRRTTQAAPPRPWLSTSRRLTNLTKESS